MNQWMERNAKYTLVDADSQFSIAFAGMKFEESDLKALAPKFERAAREMARIEAGEIKNPDEHRKVTHFTDRRSYPESELFRSVQTFAEEVRSGRITGETGKKFDAVVVNGIGGSALGPQLMQFAINGPYWNEKSDAQRNGYLKIYFLDNTDSAEFADLLEVMDPERTLHLVISKSGGTQETKNNMIAMENFYASKKLSFARHAAAITMKESELERIMYDFVSGEIDVLVSTTIIETGLDIPNVNTMIIHDSDNMGLSQLYQLRGRVGRSNRTAYAFLMYKRDKVLKEVAEKRLQAIKEFTELGSGFKIAMKDLEIRGAGNLLGRVQHGHMEAVGYDLYCKMLNEAVKSMKGQKQVIDFVTTIDLDVDAFIPESYIVNEYQKLDIYKRIAAIESRDEAEDMRGELMDRFGQIPKSVENLLRVSLIRMYAHDLYLSLIHI